MPRYQLVATRQNGATEGWTVHATHDAALERIRELSGPFKGGCCFITLSSRDTFKVQPAVWSAYERCYEPYGDAYMLRIVARYSLGERLRAAWTAFLCPPRPETADEPK